MLMYQKDGTEILTRLSKKNIIALHNVFLQKMQREDFRMKQWKRLTSVLLVLGMVLGLMPLSAFAAESAKKPFTEFTEVVDGNTYTYMPLDDGTVELTAFDTTAEAANVEIPSTATSDGKKYSVTSIGTSAFTYHEELNTVTLPDSIVSIGTGAFGFCLQLTTVNFGNSVVSIGDSAFAYTSLKSVTLPDSIVSIGASAFSSCTDLGSVTIPSRVQTIGHNAFRFGYRNENKQLEILHYKGTKAQWDELMKKEISYTDDKGSHTGSIGDLNPMLNNPKEFHYAPTVSFECGDPEKKTSKVVEYEGIVTPPDDPTAEGYQFKGWYTQENDGELFSFDQAITEDVTVYAHWSKKYTLTEKDGTLVRVTFEKNGKTVDITKNVELEQQGTTQTGKIPAGAMVTVAANAAPEGMVFAQWNISDPALMGNPDVAHTSQTMRFPMPTADVTVEAMYESAENARETELLGSAAMIGAVGISAVVLAYQAHQLGTELYLKYLLPSGAAIPQNRIQLAELLWKNAGEPVPDVNAAYEDIGLNDEAAQQAAQWVLENELMELPDEEHTGQFKPDERISYGEAIRAWKKAQQLKTAE